MEKIETINPEQIICSCCGKTIWTTSAIVFVKGICDNCYKQMTILSSQK